MTRYALICVGVCLAACGGTVEWAGEASSDEALTTSCSSNAQCANSLNGRECVNGSCTHFSTCYGAQGAECNGVPNAPCTSQGGSNMRCGVTVGSQLHDRCCARAQANGEKAYMCMGSFTDVSLCQAEWNRAANDQLFGYLWFATVSSARVQDSPTIGVANIKAPSGTKISVNDAHAGWCQNGWYYINLWTQAKCR